MAQQPSQQQSDNSMAPVWIMVLIFITAFIIWKAGHQYIVSFIFYLNVLQGKLVNLFVDNTQLANDIYLMQTIDPATVKWEQLIGYTQTVGDYVRYPIIVILVALAFLLYHSNVTLKFRKVYDMKKLRAQEQYNWPAIMPVVKLDLVSVNINEGPWAMALTPMEFARKHELLKKNDMLLDNPIPGMEFTASIRRGDAKRVFTLQLGPYFDGFEKAPPHARALAAVFLARINRDRSAASNILEVLNKGFAEGKQDYSVAWSTLKKYQNLEETQELIGQHAYLLTVMASLLQAARDDGVAPSSDFLWLKPIDRRLWYMLNCVGRQTPYAEVAGPFAHWKAELAMKRKSLVPMIDEAIKALEIAVKEVKLSPKELQELKP
ncbi:IcmP protein (plasmid) [Legionella adelaidensis]|uniref:IcmP n=1 Tax=Legionella adelaidensis TaxID=45056 RepID=Q49J26_9GAMM|nr:type IVB secretion system coupling complex protein DotM/IcmP [Legionella adelaidensis]AAX56250.1 IcmP [Legionella adelaidensis]KTC66540.1 IcmP protein [Legionella adelaidensis]VEH81156.1 IcmP protein [Legionella adelaidensis]